MTPQLYDSPGNYDFISPWDDGTYDGLESTLHIKQVSNRYNAHEGDSKTKVSNNKPL